MVALRLEFETRAPGYFPAAEALNFLNHLRFIAMGCRAKPRADLFEACALLHANCETSREAHTEALMRCLGEALGKRINLHGPGTSELTFDEAWLIQLGEAAAQRDEDSLRFLLTRRVLPEHRRLVRFLITRIADCFSLV